MTDEASRFGNLIRLRREELGLSQNELAKRAEVNQTWISRLERGENYNISLRAARRIAKVLGLSGDDLLGPPESESEPPDMAQDSTENHVGVVMPVGRGITGQYTPSFEGNHAP